MKAKYKVELRKGVYAVLTISLDLPAAQAEKAEIMDIDKEAQQNLLGQEFQRIILLLGNDDEA